MPAHVTLEGISLAYPMRHGRPTLKNSLSEWMGWRPRREPGSERLWSLLDLDLRIESGERLGIVGLNGAGKSSLLRVIAGIYPPTQGCVETQGFVVPLFQLGLGFHSEADLTSNILQAGAILGIPLKEMQRRIPGILRFAELEAFSDVPLKQLSTGMSMRLAFTTATEVSPDILLLDEVFGGGDAGFRERALQRMENLIDRTEIVVIVSHSPEVVRRLCSRVVWLEAGRIHEDGEANKVVAAYEEATRRPRIVP